MQKKVKVASKKEKMVLTEMGRKIPESQARRNDRLFIKAMNEEKMQYVKKPAAKAPAKTTTKAPAKAPIKKEAKTKTMTKTYKKSS